MPATKATQINASYLNKGKHVEDVDETSRRTGPALRRLTTSTEDDDDDTVVPSTQASTRRNSFSDPKAHKREMEQRKITLVYFEEGDPENPLNWSRGRKWMTTMLLCSMTLIIGLSTSAYSSTISHMSEEFGVAEVVGQVGMFTFNFACACVPLVAAPVGELIGRRQVYLVAFVGFTLCFLFLALGMNIETEIIGRFFSGAFGALGTILVGGSISDFWDAHDRSMPMSCFTFAAIVSTIGAPTYCGYIAQYAGWRWIEWTHMIASGLLFVVELIWLRETRGAKILIDRAKALRKETGDQSIRAPAELESENIKQLLKKSTTRAVKLMCREPVLLAFGFWIALAWGITFLFLSVIPLTFAGNHGWSEGNAGLPYIALIIGCIISFFTGLWGDARYNAAKEANDDVPIPEYRLFSSMFFAPLLPIGLYIYSFTQFASVHWIAPCIALVLIIMGIYSIFLAVYNYTSDSYGELSSSAIAGQGFMRNGFAAAFPLFATYMFNGMGYQYAGLLLAIIATLFTPLPFLLFFYGGE